MSNVETSISEEVISRQYAEQCALEKIHLLGSVQSHGYLTVIDCATGLICLVSSGIQRHYPGVDSAEDWLGRRASDWMRSPRAGLDDILDELAHDRRIDLELERRLPADGAAEDAWALDAECTAHRLGDYAVLEWVPVTCHTESPTWGGRHSIRFNASIASQVSTKNLTEYLRQSATTLREFSGYQRVMIYRFLPDWSGDVIAESVAEGETERFLGLRFPASDIPEQARALYLRNKLRVLADIDAEPDSLLPEKLPNSEPLDQSFGLLRYMSKAHYAYLRNMKVRATLTISIIVDDNLWGMVACHHNEPFVPPRHISQFMYSSSELMSSVISMRVSDLNNLEARDRLIRVRYLLDSLSTLFVAADEPVQDDVRRYLNDIAGAMNVDHLGVQVNGSFLSTWNASESAVAALAERLYPAFSATANDDVISWERAPAGLENLPGLPPDTGGVLVHRLSAGDNGFLVLVRREIVEKINWAGQPEKRMVSDDDGNVRLSPRRSFAAWTAYSRGSCEAWSSQDAELAKVAVQAFTGMTNAANTRRLQQNLAWSSTHDALTALLNRTGLDDVLRQRLGRGALGLVLLDLDNFKQINDTLGHDVGDLVLEDVAARMSTSLRQSDVFARLGGDEFVLVTDVHPEKAIEQIDAVLARVSTVLHSPIDLGGQAYQLSFSAGVVFSPEHGLSAKVLLRRADIALYRAKNGGRSRSVIYLPEMETTLRHQVNVEKELARAIADNQLVLYYQPQVSLKTRRVVGFEALVRWNHPTLGLLMPGFFLPVAEESQLIHELGRWVINEGAAQIGRWNRLIDPAMTMAVNASFAQMRDGRIITEIADALARHAVKPQNFHVELTESAIIGDEKHCVEMNAQMKALGIQIALDDFGTGYSSLSHIHTLKFDSLKIDRAFVMNIERDAQSRAVAESLINMARGLDLYVIAEGVETVSQLEWLTQAGCAFAQGYLWSPAVKPEAIPGLIQRINSGEVFQ